MKVIHKTKAFVSNIYLKSVHQVKNKNQLGQHMRNSNYTANLPS